MNEVTAMWKLWGRTRDLTVEFCERCGRVVDAASRAAALRERSLLQQLSPGMRM